MLAHYHGQTFNASEIAASLGFTAKTSKRYIDILEGTFMVRQLKPWFENISKRQVKASKVYIKDSGLLHTLLGITDFSQLQAHPKVGASWEGFAIENIVNSLEVDTDDCYFWATHNQAELDLMVIKDGEKLGFEFKYTAIPKVTKSMRIALDNLNLSEITVIVPQGPSYPLGEKIRVCSLGEWHHKEA
jgi:predicted AAA+ superfamily ATPase